MSEGFANTMPGREPARARGAAPMVGVGDMLDWFMRPRRAGRPRRLEPLPEAFTRNDLAMLAALRAFAGGVPARARADDAASVRRSAAFALFMARLLGPGWSLQAGIPRGGFSARTSTQGEGGFFDGQDWKEHAWAQYHSGLIIDLDAARFGAPQVLVTHIRRDARYWPNCSRVECLELERQAAPAVLDWLERWRQVQRTAAG